MEKWNFNKYATATLFICGLLDCTGQQISLEKVKEFIPRSARPSETRFFVGDLNRDKIEDVFLRFKEINEPEENEHFYILLGNSDGTIKLPKKDIFSFDQKNQMTFDTVTISKDGDFTVRYSGKNRGSGSYRKITFRFHADNVGNPYWILSRDEELLQDKASPTFREPTLVTQSDMRGIGGEYFGNIKESLYDVLLRMRIKKHIPDSTYECRAYSGDLNYDSFEDIILRFKKKSESENREHFHLFIGQNNGTYELAAKNDSLEIDEVDGVAFDKIVIRNGYFSLEYRGYGNTLGSYNITTFKYSKVDGNWLLYRHGSKFVHKYFTEGESTEDIRTQEDFGKILFKDFR